MYLRERVSVCGKLEDKRKKKHFDEIRWRWNEMRRVLWSSLHFAQTLKCWTHRGRDLIEWVCFRFSSFSLSHSLSQSFSLSLSFSLALCLSPTQPLVYLYFVCSYFAPSIEIGKVIFYQGKIHCQNLPLFPFRIVPISLCKSHKFNFKPKQNVNTTEEYGEKRGNNNNKKKRRKLCAMARWERGENPKPLSQYSLWNWNCPQCFWVWPFFMRYFPFSLKLLKWLSLCMRTRTRIATALTHTLIHSFALIQSIVHHYHNKLYEVIYVYADSKISDLLLLQNYLHMHQFNCKHPIPSLSVCSTLITSAKQCAARFQCYFMLKSFKMP